MHSTSDLQQELAAPGNYTIDLALGHRRLKHFSCQFSCIAATSDLQSQWASAPRAELGLLALVCDAFRGVRSKRAVAAAALAAAPAAVFQKDLLICF